MKLYLSIIICFMLISCTREKLTHEIEINPLIGTWQLVSAVTIQNDSTHVDDFSGKEMIKIINETHFSFLNHDVNNGQDSTAHFVAGGGKYTFDGQKYIEYLEYCNLREWEGNQFEFMMTRSGDSLVQRGIEKIEDLGVEREIIETYVLIK